MRIIDMRIILTSLTLSIILLGACGSDGTDADALGVGAECMASEECDESSEQACLGEFKGGYCGIKNCREDSDCPDASACVAHDDGNNYCFRTCVDKSECNENRSPDAEANCSSSVEFIEDQLEVSKACVPPSN